ncbi:MAG: hypothetical protein B193_0037 [Solidesulfovibrio magneticus str. Maddingley MBC34]|uniref:Uncharacterized protein n=1 Tax=Solidesulfovibrio magneticus str. Maddingley MBC34 TaxID=1206767 RepID=K6HFH2_9BACT|nr:MAG: hypothetical protein B193_0037 [Solidesulfovibrio magneticus str. Maddingley MBC34]
MTVVARYEYHQGRPVIAAIGQSARGKVESLTYLCPACGQVHTHWLAAADGFRSGMPFSITLPCRSPDSPPYFLQTAPPTGMEP